MFSHAYGRGWPGLANTQCVFVFRGVCVCVSKVNLLVEGQRVCVCVCVCVRALLPPGGQR